MWRMCATSCPSCFTPIWFHVHRRPGRRWCYIVVEHRDAEGHPAMSPVLELCEAESAAAACVTGTPDAAAAASGALVTTATGVPDADGGIGVRNDAFPTERGFDDDEAPFPPQGWTQVDLCK